MERMEQLDIFSKYAPFESNVEEVKKLLLSDRRLFDGTIQMAFRVDALKLVYDKVTDCLKEVLKFGGANGLKFLVLNCKISRRMMT